jgi:hypothetical protein
LHQEVAIAFWNLNVWVEETMKTCSYHSGYEKVHFYLTFFALIVANTGISACGAMELSPVLEDQPDSSAPAKALGVTLVPVSIIAARSLMLGDTTIQ